MVIQLNVLIVGDCVLVQLPSEEICLLHILVKYDLFPVMQYNNQNTKKRLIYQHSAKPMMRR